MSLFVFLNIEFSSLARTLQREGVLPPLPVTAFSDPPTDGIDRQSFPKLNTPLPPMHLRLYYLDVAYKHIQARYACLDWVKIRKWHEQADAICQAAATGSLPPQETMVHHHHNNELAAFFVWMVYGYGARMTEDQTLPGAVNHRVQLWSRLRR